MQLSGLTGIYANIEDRWFGFIEALEKRGVPAGLYVDYLEDRGIPSLPVTLAVLAMLWLMVFTSVPAGSHTVLQVDVIDDLGQPLSGANITIAVNGNIVER